MPDPLELDVEDQVERLGFELVEMERAGSRQRPVLRLRIDRPDGEPGRGVTLEDCVRVSRGVEAALDAREDLSERYLLEVSSPGVERPLVKRRDFERFRGREIAVAAKRPILGTARKVQGELIGIEGVDAEERILLRLANGDQISVPREHATKVHLIYRWGGDDR